jgi:TonB-linked SusC/RagA family outer membrane protein
MKKLLLLLTVILFAFGTTMAQRTISGTVTDQGGEPLIGASILVKGTSSGTVTDIQGAFSLRLPEGAQTLVISYTGFTTQEVAIGVSDVYNIVLQQGIILETAVVTALGVSKEEKSLGYAVQSVENAELLKANEPNFVQSLAGKVAGLQVSGSAGTAGASSFFLIRGANSIGGNNQPLIIVDGVPVDNSQLRSGVGGPVASVAYSNRAIDLNQAEIESVSVLKGAAATALYGSLAGNGAIIITTKKGRPGQQKVSVDFSSNLTVSEINKTPALQRTYAQGLFGAYAGPESRSSYSWGPRVDTLRYATSAFPLTLAQDVNRDGIYDYHRLGPIVGQSSPFASNIPVETYDHYDFFQRGIASNNNLAISAANENSSIRFSVGFLTEEGIVPKNDFERINFGLNADTKLGEKVTLGIGVQYINSGGTRVEQGSNVSGVMLGLLRTTPTFDNANGYENAADEPLAYSFPNGTPRAYRGLGGPTFLTSSVYDNPYWTANNNPLVDKVNRVIGNFNISYKPTSWLNISWRPGIDFYSDFRKQYFAIYSATLPAGQVFEDQYFSKRWNSDLLVAASTDLTEGISATLTVGHNIREFKLDNLYTQGDGLVVPGFYDISNASNVRSVADNNISRNQGYFGMLDLSLNNWLYLTGTARVESDLSLPEDNNTYLYYSGSASLVFSELLDLSSNPVFNYGKLRGSYGRVGLGTFAYSTDTYFVSGGYADGWTNGINFPFKGQSAFTLSDLLGDPNLKPEIQKSFEVGLDLRFFQNRLGLDVTYYNSESEDVILNVPITSSSGFGARILNSGSLSNTGIEAVLRANPVRSGDFSWDVLVNFTRNQNNVERLAEGVDQVFLGGFIGASTRAVVGVPYGSIFGFGFYKDAEGKRVIGADGFPVADPNEKSFDSALPDYTIGFRNTFSWKGLSLSALLDVKQGGVMWNGTKGALYFFGTHQETADLRGTTTIYEGNVAQYDASGNLVLYDHDDDPNTPDIPRTTGPNTQQVLLDENWLAFGNANGFFGSNTEDFVEDASWVRLRDVSLSYTLPARVLQKSPIRSLTLTVSARNLWLDTPYTGIDPETNLYGASNAQGLDYFNMPGTKSYTVGLQVGF